MAKAATTVTHSDDFERLKTNYGFNFVTAAQLRRYVAIHLKRPEYGITSDEFTEITGEAY